MAKSDRTKNRERKKQIIRDSVNLLLDINDMRLSDIERVNMSNFKKLKGILKTIKSEITTT